MAELGSGSSHASDQQKRAYLSMVYLGIRAALQNIVVLVATIYLTRTLERADYGIFGILRLGLTLFNLMGDGGLAAALVQQKELPDRRTLSSVWWVQMGMAAAMVGLAFIAADLLLVVRPQLPSSTPWLLRGLSISLLFTMLRSIPYLMLERELRFGWVSAIDFLGTITFYAVAVVIARQGGGASALVAATVSEAIVRAVIAYMVRPFFPLRVFDRTRAWSTLKFGLSFQATHVVGFATAALTPVLVGLRVGPQSLGDVRFAEGQGWFPTVFLGIVRRVSFPYFSRLQDNQPLLRQEFERAIVLCAIPTFYFFGLFVSTSEAMVSMVYGEKWLAAVPALKVYSFMLCINFYGWIAGGLLEALGFPQRLLRIMLIAAIVNWPICILSTWILPSALGFALGFSVHIFVCTWILSRDISERVPGTRVLDKLLMPILASIGVGALGFAVRPYTEHLTGLLVWLVSSALLYLGTCFAFDPRLRRLALTVYERQRASKKKVSPAATAKTS